MNDFDQLFDKEKPESNVEEKTSGIEDFYHQANLQRKNGILFMVYLGVLLLFSIATGFYYSIKYPDTAVIQSNIGVIEEIQVDVVATGVTENPYRITVSGSLLNNTHIDLPQIWISVEFFDSEGISLGVLSYSEDDINSGEIFSYNKSVLTDFDPVSYEFTYGFDESSMFYTVVGFLPVFITGSLFLFIDKAAFSYDWQRFKKIWKKQLGQIVTGFFMVYASLLVAQFILIELGVDTTSENELTIQGLFNNSNPFQLLMLFLLLCVFTPITEEIVFRKILYNFVQPRTSNAIAILVSGAVFGLMHVISYGDFIQAIPYVFMGLTFGFIYYRSKKNIFVTMGVHFLNNFVSYIYYLLMVMVISLF